MQYKIAEALLQLGRIQVMLGFILLIHAFLFWHWRHQLLLRKQSIIWLVCFVLGSIAFFFISGILERIMSGVSYSQAHLYGGIWTEQEAMMNMIQRWQNILLPVYLPWLCIWLVGLLSIHYIIAKRF